MEHHYQPDKIEAHWSSWWTKHKLGKPTGDGSPYCIMMPPPNVTGVLHMGHMLNNTSQHVLVRRARMQGYNA